VVIAPVLLVGVGLFVVVYHGCVPCVLLVNGV
jgi:hypothetical protein